MRLIFMGTPDLAVTALRALHRGGHEMVSVVTRPDRPRRRQSSPPEPSPVKAAAMQLGIPVLQPESARQPGLRERLSALSPETIVVVAYGQILPAEILGVPPKWCINLHASLLPRYRGAAPIARAILQGEKITGVTTMRMDQGLDTGDLLLQKECAIGLSETSGDLTSRLADIGADLLVETLALHQQGALEPRRQNENQATLAPPLRKEEGLIDWQRSAVEIGNQVRGCNPWPLAFTYLEGVAVKVLCAEVNFEAAGSHPGRPVPGRVIGADHRRIVVQCQKDSRLALLELRFPGGRTMSAGDAQNGRLIQVGDTFAPTPSA
jgi:methionyl-tRNA formyltransferase